MRVLGIVEDRSGRKLRNITDLNLQDLLGDLEIGTAGADDFVMVQDADTGDFILVPVSDFLSAGGAVTNGANVGAGSGEVFKDLSGNDLRFRTLLEGIGINISTAADEVSIVADTAEIGSLISHPTLLDLAWSVAGHTIDTDFLPDTTQAYNMGSLTEAWKGLYIRGATTDGIYIQSDAPGPTGNTPLLRIVGEPEFVAELVADQSVSWSTIQEDYAFTFTGGQFIKDFAWQFTSTATDQYIRCKPHMVPYFSATYDLGINTAGITRRWRNLHLSGNLDDGTFQIPVADITQKSTLTTNGDLYVRLAGVVSRLGIGSNGDLLTVVAGLPAWAAPAPTYTDEQAQDAVGTILTDTASVNFTYNDGANTITADVLPAGVDHGGLGGLGDDDHTQYLLANGTRALTGNWAAGAFTITAEKFIVTETDVNSSKDNFLSQFNLNATVTDTATYKGQFVDIDYSQNGAGALHASTIYGTHYDIDLTHTATVFSAPTAMFMFGTFDAAAGVALGSRVFDLSATINNTGYSGATSGAYSMAVTGATSNALIALRSLSSNSGNGRALGYQGSGQNTGSSTAEVGGIEGFCTTVNTATRVVAVSALPRGAGSPPASDKVLAFRGTSGHLLISVGSGAFTTGSASDLSTVSTTHLNFASNNGELYVQGAAEFDGKAWFDADIEVADAKNIIVATGTGTKIGTATTQKLGFWNAAPVAQYATTGTVTGHTGGGGTAVTHSDTFTGNTGATAYTIGDIVRALKLAGIMAS